ncbi:T9SS type A sorting domain-containing protein [Hanstruepera marina]|uniref:T9SS type A sorting domain-containing protein n=1 Tax=Hanstruepera marina TaxID=2873265 RepID=UPI001CA630D8|nr:T9SS type A sorting domain-containing protein [Hanstruepera marina]
MYKTFLIFTIVCLFFQTGFAQIKKKETLSSQGSSHFIYANNKSYFIQESIGQASVTFTYNLDGYALRQGFLQPISPSALNGGSDTDLDGYFYPNPFDNDIHIRFNEAIYDVLQVTLFDVLGRTIYNNEFGPVQTLDLDFGFVSSGNYVLVVRMRSKTFLAKLIRR